MSRRFRSCWGGLVLAVVFAVLLGGCASFEGARLYHSGTEALDRGDVARAIDDLERAAELSPQASEIQNHLGLAYAADGRRVPMLAAFRRAVELDCTNESARHNLARAEAGAGSAPGEAPDSGESAVPNRQP